MNDIDAQIMQGLQTLAQFVQDPQGKQLLGQIMQLQQQDMAQEQQEEKGEQQQAPGAGASIMNQLRGR